MKTLRFFDFEVLPEWWCCAFGDLAPDVTEITEDVKKDFVVVTSDDPNARDKIISLLRDDICAVGYNVKGYDLAIANCIYQGFTCKQIKIVNDMIINPGTMYDSKEHIRLQPFVKKRISNVCYQDLLDDSTGSLKEKEAVMGLSILESSIDFNKENLTEQDKEELIFYNKQDVYATMQFYLKLARAYVETKLALGKRFNIPDDVCYKSTNAKLVSIALGATKTSFADEEKRTITLPNKIVDYCRSNLPSKIMDYILNNPESLTVNLFENEVSFGNGGIHSTYKGNMPTPPCLYVESNEDYILVNVDAASYYPSMMIQFDLLSRTIHNKQGFVDIFNERIYLKTKPNKTPEDELIQQADKLVLNTTFGASGNKYLEIYDPYMCTSVCRTGQIFLAALACKITKTIQLAKIIQTNTDGILVYLPRKDLDKLLALQKEWSTISGINMELDYALKIWQRDVNNYLMIIDNNGKQKIKSKGGWLNTTYRRPGTTKTASVAAYVCSKAAIEFLVNGTDYMKYIVKDKDISDFVMVCTKGPTYRGVVQRFADGTEKQLFKANRVIATTNTYNGELYKYKVYKGETRYAKMPSIPEHCILINDDLSKYTTDDFKDLDYMYYVLRTCDMLNMQWWTFSKEHEGSSAISLKMTDRFNID